MIPVFWDRQTLANSRLSFGCRSGDAGLRVLRTEHSSVVCFPGLIVTSALMIWKSLMLITGSESPVVVVLSGSMEPAFHRGDILFLHLGKQPIRTGEVVVYNIEGRDIPIVHRVIKVHERKSLDHIDILTKVLAPPQTCVVDSSPAKRLERHRQNCLDARMVVST